jgi:hypothetical protein
MPCLSAIRPKLVGIECNSIARCGEPGYRTKAVDEGRIRCGPCYRNTRQWDTYQGERATFEGGRIETEKERRKSGPSVSLRFVIVLFILVVALWAVTPVTMTYFYTSVGERGQAGDLFGSINALFSGLAFAGVIIAILLQREELELQRHEIAANRLELARAASAQEKLYRSARLFEAIRYVEDADSRRARRIVYQKLKRSPSVPNWWEQNDELADAAATVCARYNLLGAVTLEDIELRQFVVREWSHNICTTFEALSECIQYREKGRPGAFQRYADLYHEARSPTLAS